MFFKMTVHNHSDLSDTYIHMDIHIHAIRYIIELNCINTQVCAYICIIFFSRSLWKEDETKFPLRLLAYYVIFRPWDQVRTIYREEWETMRENTDAKHLKLYLFPKTPLAAQCLPHSISTPATKSKKAWGPNGVFFGMQALQGNHPRPLWLLLPQTWSLA